MPVNLNLGYLPSRDDVKSLVESPDSNPVRDMFKSYGLPYSWYLAYRALLKCDYEDGNLNSFHIDRMEPTSKTLFIRHLPDAVRNNQLVGVKEPADWSREPSWLTKLYKKLSSVLIKKKQ